MRKYLKQHSLNAFTIQLPRKLLIDFQAFFGRENGELNQSEEIIYNRFAKFVLDNQEKGFKKLPVFDFLITFYDVQFLEENEEYLVFKLNLNEALNQSIWLKLKHTVFNQYNALIGFSEVLKEVEVLDDTEKLLIERINVNAREMFLNTKLLMEFEQMKALNFEIDARLEHPIDYLSSFLRHRQDKTELFSFEFNRSGMENSAINIENANFKTSLNLFFDMLKEMEGLSKGTLQLKTGNIDHLVLEFKIERSIFPVFN